jgi:hypothetical protein
MISVTVNEFKKVNMYKDNSVEIVLNLGEVTDDVFRELYSMKKNGTIRLLLSGTDQWVEAIQVEGKSLIDEV